MHVDLLHSYSTRVKLYFEGLLFWYSSTFTARWGEKPQGWKVSSSVCSTAVTFGLSWKHRPFLVFQGKALVILTAIREKADLLETCLFMEDVWRLKVGWGGGAKQERGNTEVKGLARCCGPPCTEANVLPTPGFHFLGKYTGLIYGRWSYHFRHWFLLLSKDSKVGSQKTHSTHLW